MSGPVRTTYTDDEIDVLDALAYAEGVKRSAMQGDIVRERLAHVLRHDEQIRQLVDARRQARAAEQGQQPFPHLRVIKGDKR